MSRHDVMRRAQRSHTYCGPGLLMLALGMSCDEAEEVIRRRRGRGGLVISTSMAHIVDVMKEHGLRLTMQRPEVVGSAYAARSTFAQWARRWRTGQWLVRTTQHVMLYVDGVVYDNMRMDGVPVTRPQAEMRARVVSVWRIDGTLRLEEGLAEARESGRTTTPRRRRRRVVAQGYARMRREE